MNKTINSERLAFLQETLHQILSETTDGISEFDLIGRLQARQTSGFEKNVLRQNHTMFQCHFILFHCLYRLRERLQTQHIANIDIHCLNIRLLPYIHTGENLPSSHDKICEYYLNFENLENTSSEDVEQLINSFWEYYVAGDQRSHALKILGLEDPIEHSDIKRHYRRLVMEHHPDRGGDKTRLQAINEAMEILQSGL